MSKCLSCQKESYGEVFCAECETDNYYICEECGKPKNSEMHPVSGRCVCNECFIEKQLTESE